MDSTVAAALLGAVVAGAGALLVPRLISMVPPWEPPPPEESPEDSHDEHDAHDERDATVDATTDEHEPPEPYADIAVLPGLAWKSAVAGVIAGGVLGAAAGWEWSWVLWVPFVPVYLALAVIDWRTRLLPTYLIWPTSVALVALVLVGWAVTGDTDAVVRAGFGMVTCVAFYFLLWLVYSRGLGFGDVRLSGPLGLALGWAGWGQVLIGVYAGFLLGGVIGGVLALVKIVQRKAFPFGPFMLLGAVVGLLWGGTLWSGLVGG
jgi:leader peptidase (prepilin peptidase) / N-methyltransferase